MIITTTDGVEGRKVTHYLGIVSGEAVLGTNILRDFMAGIRDVIGGRAAGYEEELRKAKEAALSEMAEDARALGANAIVGVDLDYEHLGGGNRSMLMVSANGTAVRIE